GCILRVVSGAAGEIKRFEASVPGGGADGLAEGRSGDCRFVQVWRRAGDLHVLFFRDCVKALKNTRGDAIDFFGVEIAKLDGELTAAGNHVAGARLDLHPPDGADLTAGLAANFFANSEDGFRGGGQSVFASVHWCCAGVVAEAGDRAGAETDAND